MPLLTHLKSIKSLLRCSMNVKSLKFYSTTTTKSTNEVKNDDNVSFAKLFRESKFVSLGAITDKVLVGRVVQVVDDDIYIDYGGKFHCICKKLDRDQHKYVRNDLVKILLKDFEMASHFLGAAKHITLLESDAKLIGLYRSKLQNQNQQQKNLANNEVNQENENSDDGGEESNESDDDDEVEKDKNNNKNKPSPPNIDQFMKKD